MPVGRQGEVVSPKDIFTPGNKFLHGDKCNFTVTICNTEFCYFPKPDRKHDPAEMTVRGEPQLARKESFNSSYGFLTTKLAQEAHER